MEKYYEVDPKEVIIPEAEQQKIREADYYSGKKTIVYYKDEEFKYYPKNNHYIIGNYGTIFSKKINKKLTNFCTDKNGYCRCYIGKTYKVHRAILETFNPIENSEHLQVNHIDCNKQHNVYDPRYGNNRVNLEWTTPLQNTRHNLITGNYIYPIGENHRNSIYTDNEIHLICQYLCNGFTAKQIAEKLKIKYNNAFQTLLCNLRKKQTWNHITCKFPELTVKYSHKKNN